MTLVTPGDFKIDMISIPSVSLKRKAAQSGSQFAVFELTVEATSNSTKLRWNVHRRYTDFTELHNKLTRSGINDIPDLPGKRMVGNYSPSFLEERRAQLDDYLKGACDSHRAVSNIGFMNFIGAVQFIDQVKEEGDNMTSFPYTFRSGRYSPHSSKSVVEETSCHAGCTIS
mmetsp:Transcript_24975/g.32540  ORF Transcript_24975/g.32540 Transcript_24975/m.32540 type:complete len:171 (-) Transcript_24975:213-725(-)|eukprot:CAMPEP_0114346640 /NCGR_PEP_ID=MMETSP0101-20121206/13233_1 /TAXON_ID=38822 ORGANISM="Pteridomonas danica, Strain PT" /NCGR_SAMPLE_ID=MMETSP0101 /ASSEMBLY_ACC=CAM_ASM_000211 /LENGTH=170 /DNA_ID=CAMNT_0001483413 /DNA_START=30 /DNA_END=542 /DNA_ORIENTATION=+